MPGFSCVGFINSISGVRPVAGTSRPDNGDENTQVEISKILHRMLPRLIRERHVATIIRALDGCGLLKAIEGGEIQEQKACFGSTIGLDVVVVMSIHRSSLISVKGLK